MNYKLLFLISGKMVKDVFEGLWQWAVVYVSYSRSRETPSSPRVPRDRWASRDCNNWGKHMTHIYHIHPTPSSSITHITSIIVPFALYRFPLDASKDVLGKGWAFVSCCRGLFPGVRKNLGWTHLLRPLSHLSSSAFCQNTEVDFCSSLI